MLFEVQKRTKEKLKLFQRFLLIFSPFLSNFLFFSLTSFSFSNLCFPVSLFLPLFFFLTYFPISPLFFSSLTSVSLYVFLIINTLFGYLQAYSRDNFSLQAYSRDNLSLLIMPSHLLSFFTD